VATIIKERVTSDGYDVKFATGGQVHTLHFRETIEENDKAEAIRQYEWRLLDEAISGNGLDEEEYDHELRQRRLS